MDCSSEFEVHHCVQGSFRAGADLLVCVCVCVCVGRKRVENYQRSCSIMYSYPSPPLAGPVVVSAELPGGGVKTPTGF